MAVRKPPHVAVIPTGTELVPIGTEPKPGDIVEFNSLMLGAMMAEWGGTATRWPAIPDDYERLKQTILAAVAASDIVVVNAGSSAGSEDYTARAVADLGSSWSTVSPCGPGTLSCWVSCARSPWSAFRAILSQRH